MSGDGLNAGQILAHAAGELDICPACGHIGHFGSITLDIARDLRCLHCGAEQITLDDIRTPIGKPDRRHPARMPRPENTQPDIPDLGALKGPTDEQKAAV